LLGARLFVEGEMAEDRMTLFAEITHSEPEGLAERVAGTLRDITKRDRRRAQLSLRIVVVAGRFGTAPRHAADAAQLIELALDLPAVAAHMQVQPQRQ
jgi:hypothetical protein